MFHSDSEVSVSINMSTEVRLYDAARVGDIKLLYTLIQEDRHVLDHIDALPFVDTPLHVGAAAGHLQFAAEIMRLKPSFALKPNQEGFCPIHLAFQCHQKRMVLRFVEINKDLVRVKGKEGITPLHLASQNGDVDLLKEFLEACPDSIKDVTVRSETALHIAVKNHQNEALEILTQWLKENARRGAIELEKRILNWKDVDGNTILHILALNNDLQVPQWFPRVRDKMDLRANNVEGKTASDIAGSPEIKSLLKAAEEGKLIREIVVKQRWMMLFVKTWTSLIRRTWGISEEERNAYLVVAVLIATATYQAALSPPGGLYQASPGTQNNLSHIKTMNTSVNWKPTTGVGGNSVMTDRDFIAFSLTNMSSFFLSTFAILYLLPKKLSWSYLLSTPTVFLQLSYIFAMMVISPTRVTTIFLLVLYAIWMVAGYVLYGFILIYIFLRHIKSDLYYLSKELHISIHSESLH